MRYASNADLLDRGTTYVSHEATYHPGYDQWGKQVLIIELSGQRWRFNAEDIMAIAAVLRQQAERAKETK